jgi:hypothetical protein
MAVGDDATADGYPLVPDTGDAGKVKLGAQEINRTRDFVAQVKNLIPVGNAAYQAAAGILQGTAVPDNSLGVDGNIYFKIL